MIKNDKFYCAKIRHTNNKNSDQKVKTHTQAYESIKLSGNIEKLIHKFKKQIHYSN